MRAQVAQLAGAPPAPREVIIEVPVKQGYVVTNPDGCALFQLALSPCYMTNLCLSARFIAVMVLRPIALPALQQPSALHCWIVCAWLPVGMLSVPKTQHRLIVSLLSDLLLCLQRHRGGLPARHSPAAPGR